MRHIELRWRMHYYWSRWRSWREHSKRMHGMRWKRRDRRSCSRWQDIHRLETRSELFWLLTLECWMVLSIRRFIIPGVCLELLLIVSSMIHVWATNRLAGSRQCSKRRRWSLMRLNRCAGHHSTTVWCTARLRTTATRRRLADRRLIDRRRNIRWRTRGWCACGWCSWVRCGVYGIEAMCARWLGRIFRGLAVDRLERVSTLHLPSISETTYCLLANVELHH